MLLRKLESGEDFKRAVFERGASAFKAIGDVRR
jgi:hypothetical protein